jgi:hypothetical protein
MLLQLTGILTLGVGDALVSAVKMTADVRMSYYIHHRLP